MTVANYSTTASSNADTPPNGAPENMLASKVNDTIRQIMADIRTYLNDAQWIEYLDGDKSGAVSYVSTNVFKITGSDATAFWHVGRRVKVTNSSGGNIKNGTITAVSYSGGATNVTVDVSLTNEVIRAFGSVLEVTNHGIPPEIIKAMVGEMLSGNTTTNITVTYQSADDTIDFVIADAAVGTKGVVALYNGSDSTSTALAPTAAALKVVADAVAASGSGDMLSSNNLSDVASAVTARSNLGLEIGVDVQAYDASILNAADIGSTVQGHSAVLDATTEAFTTADGTKLDGIEANANNYSHPSGDGNLHVPATGTTNNGKVLTAGATAGAMTWETPASGSDNNFTDAYKTKLDGIATGADVTGSNQAASAAQLALSATTSTDTTCYIPLVGTATTSAQNVFIDNLQLTYNASTAVITVTDITVTSDERLKTNINAMPVDWRRFNSYYPVLHEWKDHRKGVFPGFVAQQIREINPAVVEERTSDGILSVNYAKLMPEAFRHIQDLYQQIQDMKELLIKHGVV